jgi:hypothetical protein
MRTDVLGVYLLVYGLRGEVSRWCPVFAFYAIVTEKTVARPNRSLGRLRGGSALGCCFPNGCRYVVKRIRFALVVTV